MAIDNTGALIKTALLPEQQMLQGGGRGMRGPQEFKSPIPGEDYFGIPKSPEGLQYTDKLMKSSVDLFKKRQDLINYAKTMWTRYDIDVTNPDPSRQESVVAAEAFKQEIGNYLSSVDRAKEGQKIYTDLLQRQAQNKYAFGDQIGNEYASSLSPDELGYSTEVLPELEFAAKGINQTFDSGADYRGAQKDAGMFQQAYNNTSAPGSAGVQARAAQSLNPVLNIPQDSDSGNNNPVIGLVTEYAQLAAGTHPSFQITNRVGPQGSYLSESTDNGFVGRPNGKYQDPSTQITRDFIITKIIKDNDTGEVYAVNDAGFRKPLPKDNIDPTLRQILPASSINEYEKYLADAQKRGLLPSTTGQGGLSSFTLPASMFVPIKDVQTSQQSTITAQTDKQLANQIQQDISSSLDILDSSNWNHFMDFFGMTDAPTELEYDSELGKVRVLKTDEDAYTVKINGEYRKDPKTKKTVKHSKAMVNDLLTHANVVGMKLLDKKGQEVKKTTSRAEIKALVGSPGYEGYSEQELIDYYKSQGYNVTE